MADHVKTDLLDSGLYRDRYSLEDGKLWRVREQTNRDAILQANAALRSAEARRLEGMRWALSIPQDDYDMLKARHPELASTDQEVKRRAWQRFMVSAESLPYRVVETARGRTA